MTLSLVVSVLALVTASVSLRRVYLGSKAAGTRPAPPYDDSELRELLELVVQELESVRADYGEWKADINTAVAEGIKHVERAENRIRATVRRAREELEEGGVRSPGLEAEARDLFGEHGDGGGARGVPPVPNGVGGGQPGRDFSAFPGDWS